MVSPNEKDRFMGNVAMTYQLTEWLSLFARTGTKCELTRELWSTDMPERKEVLSGPGDTAKRCCATGIKLGFHFKSRQTIKDLSLVVQVAGIHRTNYYKSNYTRVNELTIDGVYNLGNNASPNLNESSIVESEMNSLCLVRPRWVIKITCSSILPAEMTGQAHYQKKTIHFSIHPLR